MTCTIPGCDRPVRARGWCSGHYRNWYMRGDPMNDVGPRLREKPNRRVSFTADLWRRWQDQRAEPHPHAGTLADGIGTMRALFEQRSGHAP